ncbi:hypothetical protein I7I48_04414 [Histoplasma ohiense]|nr:hypothetical protein I7I48_04414 [Histoplasma ohiense (nom. inval.)]
MGFEWIKKRSDRCLCLALVQRSKLHLFDDLPWLLFIRFYFILFFFIFFIFFSILHSRPALFEDCWISETERIRKTHTWVKTIRGNDQDALTYK